MEIRDLVVAVSCLAIAAGAGVMSLVAPDSPHNGVVSAGGIALIVAGVVASLIAILSAALEKPPQE